jgi:hypothetical protein
MSPLRITTTDALIGINTTPTKLKISQPRADIEMHTKQAMVIMKTEPIQIKIDQSQCFNEAGLKNNEAFTEDIVQRAAQAVLDGMARSSTEGDYMANIENKSNAIAEIAADNSITTYDFNVDFIPKSRPKIEFVGGNVDIQVDEGYVDLKVTPNKPIIDVEVGGIEFYLRQKPDIKIEYVGDKVDKTI